MQKQRSQQARNAIQAMLRHPRIVVKLSGGWSAVDTAYWQLEQEKERKKYIQAWNAYFMAKPDGLMQVQGFYIYVPQSANLFSLLDGVYEPNTTAVFSSLIDKGTTVVDVGANLGYYTLLAAKVAKKVHAFEPEPDNFEMLSKSVERNAFRNVDSTGFA